MFTMKTLKKKMKRFLEFTNVLSRSFPVLLAEGTNHKKIRLYWRTMFHVVKMHGQQLRRQNN